MLSFVYYLPVTHLPEILSKDWLSDSHMCFYV